MAPGIKRSIEEGFRAANKSVKGIAFYVGGLIVVTALTLGGIFVTNPPPELFQEPAAVAVDEGVFAVDEDTMTLSEAVLADEEQERTRIVSDWFGRAWFLILLSLLIAMAGNLWLSGGQIGYMAKQITGPPTPVSEFWVVGTRAFLPLLGGTAFVILGAGVLALIAALLGALATVLPDALSGVLAILLMVAFFVGGVWLLVRLAFWFIAIVTDRLGPVAALKASFRSTQTHWWRIFGLGVLMVLLSYAVQLPFALLGWLGGTIGGGVETALGLISSVVGTLVSLYVGFITLGAYVRFYEDVKTTPATSPARLSPSPGQASPAAP